MSAMFAKIGQVTVANIWSSLWRAMVWVGLVRLFAYWLDIPWSWWLFLLMVLSDLVSHLVYYSRRYPAGHQ